MSQFFDQYNAILEKSLQKVRLRVDPNVKYAEDFAQYDGYVGYILAETDDSFDFFYENSTVTLPKNAVFVEGVGDFIRGAAGQNTGSSVSGALGSIASSALKGAAKAGLAMHGIPSSAYSSSSNSAQSQQAPSPGSALKFPPMVDRSQAIPVEDKDGYATVKVHNTLYGFSQIFTNNTPSITLQPESFIHLIDDQLNMISEQQLALPASSNQLSTFNNSPSTPMTGVASNQGTWASKTPLRSTAPPIIDVDAKQVMPANSRYIKIAQIISNKNLLNAPVTVFLQKYIKNKDAASIEGNLPNMVQHQGVFLKLGNSPNIVFVFQD